MKWLVFSAVVFAVSTVSQLALGMYWLAPFSAGASVMFLYAAAKAWQAER